MCVDVHFDAKKIKLGLSKIAVHFDAGKPQLNATEISDLLWGRQRPPKLKRPYIPPTQSTHAPRRMGRNPRRRNAARPTTCGNDDSPGDDVPHVVYHGCTFNIVNSDPVLAGELAAMKAELESVFGNFSFYSYKKACGQKKTVRGSKNSRRLSNGTPAI